MFFWRRKWLQVDAFLLAMQKRGIVISLEWANSRGSRDGAEKDRVPASVAKKEGEPGRGREKRRGDREYLML